MNQSPPFATRAASSADVEALKAAADDVAFILSSIPRETVTAWAEELVSASDGSPRRKAGALILHPLLMV